MLSAKAELIIIFSPKEVRLSSSEVTISKRPYLYFEENAIALFAGIVHGVVVHINIHASFNPL